MLYCVFVLILFLLIHTCYYSISCIHKPRIHTKHQEFFGVASKSILPMYLLHTGFSNSIYQLIRRVDVTKFSIRKELFVPIEENVSLFIEMYEPALRKPRRKSRASLILGTIFGASIIQLFLVMKFTKMISKSLIRLVSLFFHGKYASGLCKLGKRMITKSGQIRNRIIASRRSSSFFFKKRLVIHPITTPITDNILLIHGLNGTSRSTYIKGMANVFLEKNCRVFCFNARGAMSAPSTSTFSHIGLTSDLDKVVNYILENFTGSLSIIGFSMGANWVGKYLGEQPRDPRIKMGVCVCCPFDFVALKKHFTESLYGRILNRFMTWNYKRYLKRSLARDIDLRHCKSLVDVDTVLLEDVFKSKSLDEFYHQNSCINYLDNITVPTLFLSANDDPLIPEKVLPVEYHKKNENLTFLIMKGGHLGFFSNSLETTSAEVLVEKYFDVISALQG